MTFFTIFIVGMVWVLGSIVAWAIVRINYNPDDKDQTP